MFISCQVVIFFRVNMKYLNQRNFSILMWFLFACGIFFHWFSFTRPIVIRLTDIFLLLMNAGVLFFLIQSSYDKKIALWLLVTVSLTYLAELAGIHTGKIFGHYLYGNGMQWKPAAVPIVIALNWAVLILASWSWARLITRKPLLEILAAIFLIVAFDLILEPLAMKMDYWQWENGAIPVQNYLAWAFIAGIFLLFLKSLKISFDGKLLRQYFLEQIIFFLLILFLIP